MNDCISCRHLDGDGNCLQEYYVELEGKERGEDHRKYGQSIDCPCWEW